MTAATKEAWLILDVVAAAGPFYADGLATLPVKPAVKRAMAAICYLHGIDVGGGKIVLPERA